jgi:DNA-binding NarL/FixJ family response regulator
MWNKEEITTAVPPVPGTIPVTAGPAHSFAPTVKVWLVDDNDQIRALVAELLNGQGGIECARHFSSPDALLSELASRPGPDVILLDVQMGDRNGLDAVRPIKSLTRATRVLMFTTSNDPAWRERALHEGASDYLLKSSPMDKVAERIRGSANDQASGTHRRRHASCPAKRPLQRHLTGSITDTAPQLLSRMLKRLLGSF